jgi:hypothetical protein
MERMEDDLLGWTTCRVRNDPDGLCEKSIARRPEVDYSFSSMEYRRPAAAALLAALALTSAAAPATARPGPFGYAGERSVPIAVTVEEVPAEDVWNLVYVLPREVAGVEFVSDRNAFRAERWGVGLRAGEPVWHVDRQRRGRERLCFTEPARAFSVGFRTWTDPLPKDYELNAAFSEGSRLLYTGHLRVRPLESCGATDSSPLPGLPEHRFTFTTTEGRGVRVAGDAGSGSLRWTPPAGPDGDAVDTYVYFGDLPPVERPLGEQAATVLLDPGLPEWMRREMADAVPRLVERFTDLTDTPLPFRPLLLVTWGGSEGSGYSFSGGTLPGMLLASAEGPGWLEESEEVRREWFHRLAHETFHLWDGEIYRPDDESEWLSEAAADHFAVDAAIAFGRRSEAEAESWLIERANDCLVRLAGRSLLEAAGGSDYDAPIEVGYSCGAVALATAHGALRRAEPPSDLATLFRRLFEHAAATGSYGTAPFLGGLRELRADPDAVTEIRRLILTGQSTRAEVLLQRLLAHAGVATVPVAPAEAAADPNALAEGVRRAVGRCWCGSEADRECDPIEIGKGVTAVDGEPLRAGLGSAWDRITAAARGAELRVTLDGLDTTLFCGPELFDPTWSALLAPAPPG